MLSRLVDRAESFQMSLRWLWSALMTPSTDRPKSGRFHQIWQLFFFRHASGMHSLSSAGLLHTRMCTTNGCATSGTAQYATDGSTKQLPPVRSCGLAETVRRGWEIPPLAPGSSSAEKRRVPALTSSVKPAAQPASQPRAL